MTNHKAIYDTQLSIAKSAISKARQDNEVTHEVGEALLALQTAVAAIASAVDDLTEQGKPRYGRRVL